LASSATASRINSPACPNPRGAALRAEADALAGTRHRILPSTLSYGRAQDGRAPRRRADPDRARCWSRSRGIGGPCLGCIRSPGSARSSAGFPSTPGSRIEDVSGCCSIWVRQRGAGARKSAPQQQRQRRRWQIRITGRSEGSDCHHGGLPITGPGRGTARAPRAIFSRHSKTSSPPRRQASGLGARDRRRTGTAPMGGDIHLVEGTIGATFRIVIPDPASGTLEACRNERARA